MNAFHRSRAAVCGGAIVLALGAGMVVVPAAGATTLGSGLLGGSTSGGAGTGTAATGSALGAITGALGSTTSTATTTVVAPVTGATGAVTSAVGAVAGSVVSTVSTSTGGVTDPLVSTEANGGATTIGLLNGGDGSLATVTLGTTGSTGGTGTSSGAAVGGTAFDTVSDTLSGLLDGQGEGTTAGGSGGTAGTGTIHVDVQIGGTAQGEATTSVTVPSAVPTSVSVDAPPAPSATPVVSTPIVSTPMATTSVPAPVTTAASEVPVPTSAPTESATPSPAPTVTVPAVTVPTTSPVSSAVKARLLSLRAAPSIATVFPVKDGYLDDVVFHLAATTSTGRTVSVEGQAVLKRGSREVARWTIGRSTQDLRWNGLDRGTLVAGSYALVASLTDATGGTHTATTKVTTSPKKLVAATTRLSAFAVSGKHAMAAAPRAGLAKGAVTVRIKTVATKVKGKQSLIFEKAGRRIVVPIKAGTHTSRLITIPKSFTSFTVRHTWKKGQVALKSVQTTYSYQTLR